MLIIQTLFKPIIWQFCYHSTEAKVSVPALSSSIRLYLFYFKVLELFHLSLLDLACLRASNPWVLTLVIFWITKQKVFVGLFSVCQSCHAATCWHCLFSLSWILIIEGHSFLYLFLHVRWKVLFLCELYSFFFLRSRHILLSVRAL